MPSSARGARLVALMTVCGLALAACGNSTDDGGGGSATTERSTGDGAQATSDAPGVTDDQVAYAVLATGSGDPTGQCLLDCYVDGIEAYFAFRNDEGGVDGRELALTEVVDDELSNNQVRALELIEANDTFGVFSVTQLASGWPDLADAGVPLYTWYVNAVEAEGQPSIFPAPAGVRCVDCASRLYVYAASLGGGSRVASIGYGVSQASKDCVGAQAASVEQWGGDAGLEVAYTNDDLAFGLPNGIAPEVTAMKDADVDFILTCIDQNGAKTLAQELERQGMDDVHMLLPAGYNEAFIAESGGLFEGDVIQAPFRPYEAEAGDTQLGDFLEWMEETGSEPTELAMFGWINADLAYQGLVAAGDDLTRENVIAATNEMTDWSAGGLINPIDWTRQHEPPTDDDPVSHGPAQECYSFVQVGGDGFDLATGTAAEPFVCWDPSDRAWSDPEPAALQ